MQERTFRVPTLVKAALIGASLLLTGTIYAQNPLFRPPAPRVFESPDGLFKVQLPGKWQVTEFRPGQSTTLKPLGARPETQLIIQRIEVPPGAHPRLLRLKAVENRLGKLSGFRELAKADVVVSGYPAIPNRLWLRCSAAFSKLPEMAKTLRELKRNVPR